MRAIIFIEGYKIHSYNVGGTSGVVKGCCFLNAFKLVRRNSTKASMPSVEDVVLVFICCSGPPG